MLSSPLSACPSLPIALPLPSVKTYTMGSPGPQLCSAFFWVSSLPHPLLLEPQELIPISTTLVLLLQSCFTHTA